MVCQSTLYFTQIILFDSEEGLQKSLDGLNEFCTNWQLDVSHETLKVIVFN